MGKEAQKMPLRYKINILNALKEKGYNTNRIRTEGLFSQSTLQKLREGKGLSWENIERICGLLECQPGDLIEYVQENNWFHKHISACSKSQKSAGYAPVSVQQMRDTLLRAGGVFREKEASLVPGRALVWLGKFQMGFRFSNSADGKEKSGFPVIHLTVLFFLTSLLIVWLKSHTLFIGKPLKKLHGQIRLICPCLLPLFVQPILQETDRPDCKRRSAWRLDAFSPHRRICCT